MDLFEYMHEKNSDRSGPLSVRMRPRTLEEVVGQEHILGKDMMLPRAIRADSISSLIFYGPPGTGKTTLARVIAGSTSAEFKQINATASGKKDMEEVVAQAKTDLGMYNRKTILFIDEIHRFNKSQQDYLLPFVEDGTVVLIGATTENPFFEVNQALLSRSVIFELKPLSKENVRTLLLRALTDSERGLGGYDAVADEEALEFLSSITDGDAREALNALELGVVTTDRSEDGKIHITLPVAESCIQKKHVRYDTSGDQHYDVISAFIKSMRGSDPDAAVFYLARMLSAGEDIRFISRRMMILASEDIGMADPQALVIAVSAAQAIERVGLPEAQLILSQAAIYLATAPKSNACCNAISAAMDAVRTYGNAPVPDHLKDAHYPGAKELGHGTGYQYPHLFPGHYISQQYLPDGMEDIRFYEPSHEGREAEVAKRLDALRKNQA